MSTKKSTENKSARDKKGSKLKQEMYAVEKMFQNVGQRLNKIVLSVGTDEVYEMTL